MTARPDSLLGLWRELLTALGVHRPETSPDDLLADIAEVLRADETRVRVIELPLRLAQFRDQIRPGDRLEVVVVEPDGGRPLVVCKLDRAPEVASCLALRIVVCERRCGYFQRLLTPLPCPGSA
jgi:hypothetical protein